ncbi:MAG: HXXEE domain-containing protein [Tractidigestivibacter sp.]|jgi:hypothetical protein|uniref:arsenate reductase/protein-tyrosine-phosphatase family protein n=1 Tax=Tractidigestivibacter sp. TaxID=2847320 RepID=UPI003D8E0848
MTKKNVAFICTQNACRSQIAEALAKYGAFEGYEFYSAGSEPQEEIDPDAMRILRIAFPLLASMGRRRPMASLVLASSLFVNGLMHAILWIAGTYTAGALTSVCLFLPLPIWILSHSIGSDQERFPVAALVASLLIGGVLMHAVLIASTAAYVKAGAIGFEALVAIQLINASLLVSLGWIVSGTRLGRR